MLADTDRHALLAAARDAVRRALAGDRSLPAPPAGGPLAEPRAVFASLVRPDGSVRGSVGTSEPRLALLPLACELAIRAALDDPRHVPLAAAGAAGLVLELAVATGRRRVVDPAQLDPAAQAVRVRRGLQSAVLLPAAARARGWDARRALAYACHLAGLPGDAWADPETIVEALTVDELRAVL